MTVTVQDVAKLVGAKADDSVLPALLAQATAILNGELGQAMTRVPSAQYDGALLQLCSELWQRRKGPEGSVQWGPNGEAVRLGADPMYSVRPLIRRYLPIGPVR